MLYYAPGGLAAGRVKFGWCVWVCYGSYIKDPPAFAAKGVPPCLAAAVGQLCQLL